VRLRIARCYSRRKISPLLFWKIRPNSRLVSKGMRGVLLLWNNSGGTGVKNGSGTAVNSGARHRCSRRNSGGASFYFIGHVKERAAEAWGLLSGLPLERF